MIQGLLTDQQAAEYLGVKSGTLAVWRCTKKHKLPYIKVGRIVRYRKEELDEWLEKHTVYEK